MKKISHEKAAIARQAENVERASWFARLAFGDWVSAPAPAPVKRRSGSFHVLP